MISVVILTKNEKSNVVKCLKSVLWADEVIVVDDFSEKSIFENIGNTIRQWPDEDKKKIIIYQRNLNGDFSGQRNFALEKTNGEWVLFIDSDEEVTKEGASEIKSQISCLAGRRANLKSDTIAGFYLKRRDFFLGRRLKYGETADIRLLRLAKKNAGKWEGRVHEKWEITGKTDTLITVLEHYPHPAISSFLTKINRYSDIVAQCWFEEGRKMHGIEVLIYPLGKFLYNYLIKLGFMDGVPGFIMASMMSFHSFLARGKYWLLVNKRRNLKYTEKNC